jgi:AraC-like DNA-binding protein
MLLPDAFHAITGREPGEYVNQTLPAMGVLGDEWQVMSDAVRSASDDDARVRLVQDFLAPLWAEMRPIASFHGRLIQDWSHALSLRAATSGFGRSLRQVERRIKLWAGQPLRNLKGLVRMETAMLDAVLAIQQGEVDWAELAVASGFSDQAHLCRQIRLLTGFSPQELMRRAMQEEAFWFYRLWSGVPHVPAQGIAEPEEAARQPEVDIDSAAYFHRI